MTLITQLLIPIVHKKKIQYFSVKIDLNFEVSQLLNCFHIIIFIGGGGQKRQKKFKTAGPALFYGLKFSIYYNGINNLNISGLFLAIWGKNPFWDWKWFWSKSSLIWDKNNSLALNSNSNYKTQI